MKSLLKCVVAVLGCLLAVPALPGTIPDTPVQEVLRPGGSTDGGAARIGTRGVQIYDSGDVGAGTGAAVDTGVLDTSKATILTVYITKGDSTSRTPTLTAYQADGTTVKWTATTTACASSACIYNYGITASGGTASMAMALPAKFKFVLAAGGTVSARVTVDIR